MRCIFFALCALGCDDVGAFHCTDSSSCTLSGAQGTCETTGFCSFADSECASGRRYGEFAGAGLAGTCVGASATDGPVTMPDGPAMSDGPTTTFDPPWWDSSFHTRQPLTIENPGTATLPSGFQLGFPIDLDALIPSLPFAALHVVRWVPPSGPWQELTRVIDDNGTHAEWAWLRLPAAIAGGGMDTSVWIYYANATPAAPNDPTQVFDLYEDFSTGLGDFSSNGTVATATGELQLGTNGSVKSNLAYGPGTAVDWALRMPTFSFRFWGGFQVNGTFADDAPWIIWIARGPAAEIWPEYQDNSGGMFVGNHVAIDAARHIYGTERLADRVVFRRDDVVAQQYTMAPVTDLLQVRATNESSQPVFSNMVRVRQSTFPYPTVTFGNPETNP